MHVLATPFCWKWAPIGYHFQPVVYIYTSFCCWIIAPGLSSILLPTWLSSIFRRFYIYIYFKHPCSILSLAPRALALGVMKAFLFVVSGVHFCIVSCIFGKFFLCVKHLIDSLFMFFSYLLNLVFHFQMWFSVESRC